MINWAGTRYRLHPLFVLTMLLSALTGYFVELITLFGIVAVHEMGHVAAARGFGWRVTDVQLLPFGGVAAMDIPPHASAWREIAVALAGPLQNGWLVALSLLLRHAGIGSAEWSSFFMEANIAIGLFNLIPVLPLDGGKVMQALFSLWMTYHKTIVCSTWISLAMSVFVTGSSFYTIGEGPGVQPSLLMIGLFLVYSNWYAYRNIPFSFLRFLMSREASFLPMLASGVLARPIVVGRQRSIAQVVKLFMKGQYHLVYVMNEQGRIQGVLPEQRILRSYIRDPKPGSAVSELFM